MDYYKIRGKNILRPILFAMTVVFLFAFVVIGAVIMATIRVLFNAVLLYRGYRPYLKRNFILLNRIQLFIQSLGLGSNIGRVSYPIAYFMSWLSAITIDLTSSFEVDCTGSVAPIYLLIDFMITAVVVLNISNNINIFWFTMVTECTSEFVKLLSNRFYLQTGVCKSLSTLSYVLTGFFLRIFPSPMKINQYLLSFVYISVFFANNGVSKSNKNCDAAGGSPTDTSTAVFTSLFVMFLILPMVYMFGQVLYPMPFAYEDLLEENDDDNGDDDGDSYIVDGSVAVDEPESNNNQESQQQTEQCLDTELWWRYATAWTSVDWFFVKALVVFAQRLETNMQNFLSSTLKYLQETPSLRTLSMTEELKQSLAVRYSLK